MYAQKESLAIDGKAMYFRGRCQALDLGLRPSDVTELSPERRRDALWFIELRRGQHRGRAALQRRVTDGRSWASAPVAPLGLEAGAGGFANAALKGPLFHDASGVRKFSGRSKPSATIFLMSEV
jgi:hypothetical protein